MRTRFCELIDEADADDGDPSDHRHRGRSGVQRGRRLQGGGRRHRAAPRRPIPGAALRAATTPVVCAVNGACVTGRAGARAELHVHRGVGAGALRRHARAPRRRRARGGSPRCCPARWACARRPSCRSPATSSTPARRSGSGWSTTSCRTTSCCRSPGRWSTTSPPPPRSRHVLDALPPGRRPPARRRARARGRARRHAAGRSGGIRRGGRRRRGAAASDERRIDPRPRRRRRRRLHPRRGLLPRQLQQDRQARRRHVGRDPVPLRHPRGADARGARARARRARPVPSPTRSSRATRSRRGSSPSSTRCGRTTGVPSSSPTCRSCST